MFHYLKCVKIPNNNNNNNNKKKKDGLITYMEKDSKKYKYIVTRIMTVITYQIFFSYPQFPFS